MKPGQVRSLQKQAAIYLLDHRHEIKLHHAIHNGQTSAHMNAVLVRVVQKRLNFLDDILIDLYRRYHTDSDILKTDAMVMEDRAEKVRWLSMVIRHRRRPTETSLQRMRIFYAVTPS